MPSTGMCNTETTVCVEYDSATGERAIPVNATVFALDQDERRTGLVGRATVWTIPAHCTTTADLEYVADEVGGAFYDVAAQLGFQGIEIDDCLGTSVLVVEGVSHCGANSDCDNVVAIQQRALALALDAAGSRFGATVYALDSYVDDSVLAGLAFEKTGEIWVADCNLLAVDQVLKAAVHPRTYVLADA